MKSILLLILLGMLGAGAAHAQALSYSPTGGAWSLHDSVSEPRSVVLRADAEEAAVRIPASWRPQTTTLNWVDYAILTATGAAAVVAVHYKFEADKRYDSYQQTGDPALRTEIRNLDRRSGLALIGVQAGVTVFAVRLLLR